MELVLEEDQQPTIITRTEIEAKAQALKDSKALPTKPGDNVAFKDLVAWSKLLTPEMTADNRICIYVYRMEPIINRQLDNPEADNNIDIFMLDPDSELNEEYFINRHGGGRYKLVVKDFDKPKTQKGGYFEARLYIPMNLHDPKLNLMEVDWDNARNKGFRSWALAKGLIDKGNMPVELKPKTDNTAVAPDAVALMKLAMDFASKMTDKDQQEFKRRVGGEDALGKNIGDILLEQMKQQDPNKQMATMVTLITAMKGMQPEVKPDNTMTVMIPMFMEMMKQQAESANRHMTMFVEMMKANANKPVEATRNIVSEMKEILSLAKELNPGGGEGVAVKKSTAEVMMEGITQLLPPALGLAATFLQQRNAPTSPLNTNTVPTGVTGATVAPVSPNPQQLPQPTQQPSVDPTPITMTQSEAVTALNQFAPFIVPNLSKEGWEFAEWLCIGFPQGEQIVHTIIKMGVDEIITVSKQVPMINDAVEKTYGDEHFRKWVTSFVNFKEEIAKMEEEENKADGNS